MHRTSPVTPLIVIAMMVYVWTIITGRARKGSATGSAIRRAIPCATRVTPNYRHECVCVCVRPSLSHQKPPDDQKPTHNCRIIEIPRNFGDSCIDCVPAGCLAISTKITHPGRNASMRIAATFKNQTESNVFATAADMARIVGIAHWRWRWQAHRTSPIAWPVCVRARSFHATHARVHA